jgi:hypothetical protein
MTLTRWDRAGRSPVKALEILRPELAQLPTDLPTVAQLFTFMRDAELRFDTLRLSIEERTWGTKGEVRTLIDVLLRHPGFVRTTTSVPARGTRGNYELWLSDGQTVRTYSGISKVATERPMRPRIRGLDSRDLPGMSTVYEPLTPLQMETLPETFIHPAGFCQVIVVESRHPRTVEVSQDRPDHDLQVWVDREIGIITRLVETIGGELTRDALVTTIVPDAALPPTAFDFTLPSDARLLF